MSRCSVGVTISLRSGKQIKHKYYAADQLKEFVLTCDISELMKVELRKLKGPAIDNWVLKNQQNILPQYYAAQRINDNGKPQPPRLMSFAKYNEDEF